MLLKKNYYCGLAIFRVITGFLLLKNYIFYLPMAKYLFGKDAIYPIQNYIDLFKYFNVSYLAYPFEREHWLLVYLIICIILSALFVLGIGRNITSIVLYIFVINLSWRNGFILDGSDNVVQVTLPFLAISNSFKYLTWNNGYVNSESPIKYIMNNSFFPDFKRQLNDFAVIGIWIQISFVYLFTALAKLQGKLWLNGTAVYYTMRVDEFMATSWNIPLTQNHYFVVLSTYFTVFWELSFPFLVWFRQTKRYTLLLGVILHFGIWIFMRIDNFSWIMIGSYFVFLTDLEYKKNLSHLMVAINRLLAFKFQ